MYTQHLPHSFANYQQINTSPASQNQKQLQKLASYHGCYEKTQNYCTIILKLKDLQLFIDVYFQKEKYVLVYNSVYSESEVKKEDIFIKIDQLYRWIIKEIQLEIQKSQKFDSIFSFSKNDMQINFKSEHQKGMCVRIKNIQKLSVPDHQSIIEDQIKPFRSQLSEIKEMIRNSWSLSQKNAKIQIDLSQKLFECLNTKLEILESRWKINEKFQVQLENMHKQLSNSNIKLEKHTKKHDIGIRALYQKLKKIEDLIVPVVQSTNMNANQSQNQITINPDHIAQNSPAPPPSTSASQIEPGTDVKDVQQAKNAKQPDKT